MNKKGNHLQKILKIFTSDDKTIKHEIVEAIRMSIGLNIKKGSAEKQIDKYLNENKITLEQREGIKKEKLIKNFEVVAEESKNILRWELATEKNIEVILTRISDQENQDQNIIFRGKDNQYIDEAIEEKKNYIYEILIASENETPTDFCNHSDKKTITLAPIPQPIQTVREEGEKKTANPSSNAENFKDKKNMDDKNAMNKNQENIDIRPKVFKLFIFLLGYWAVMPIVMVILGLSFPFLPFSSGFWTKFATFASLFWVLSALLLLLIPECFTNWGKEKKKRSDNIGLICTLTIGVPGILFGSLSLLQNLEDFPYQPPFVQSSVKVNLSSTEKTANIFILDVSDSFFTLKKNGSKENYSRAIDIMKLIIGDNDQKSATNFLRNSDEIFIYTMSGEPVKIGKEIKRIVKSLSEFQNNVFAELEENIKEIKNISDSQHTGISQSLKLIYEDMKEEYIQKTNYSHANIIIFSDFIQDMGEKTRPRHEVQQQIWALATNIQENPIFSLTAFYAPSMLQHSTNTIDILPLFEKSLSRNKFKKININEFNEMKEYDKAGTLSINLFKQELVNKPLFLRYNLFPWSPIPAELIFSKTLKKNNPVYISLVKSNKKPSNVRVRLKNPDIVLSIEDSDRRPVQWYPDDKVNSFSIRLEHENIDSRSNKHELHLAFPDLAVTKIIPLIIAPVLVEPVMRIVLITIFGLLVIPVIIAYTIYREWNMVRHIKLNILFLCFNNSCRSKIAEAFTQKLLGDRITPWSAGFAMSENNIDHILIDEIKKHGIAIDPDNFEDITRYRNYDFDYVITLSELANEEFNKPNYKNWFPGITRIHNRFDNPSNFSNTNQKSNYQEGIKNICKGIQTFVKKMPKNLN